METDIKIIEKAIQIPSDRWAGKCHEIAQLIYKAGLVPKGSKVIYGMWWGRIAEGNTFSGRPFTHHGWIELPDGRIYDPTRFVFFNKTPSIWIGNKSKEYDAGSNRLLELNQTPRPEPKGTFCELAKEQAEKLKPFITDGEKGIYISDCFWLGNLPLSTLKDKAKDVYEVLVEIGHGVTIPIDNKNMVLGG